MDAMPRPDPHKCLIITGGSLRPTAFSAPHTAVSWSDAIPTPTDYSIVVAEIPPAFASSGENSCSIFDLTRRPLLLKPGTADYVERVLSEFVLAPRFGTCVVWLLAPGSDALLAERILGAEVHSLREDAPGTRFEAPDPAFSALTATIGNYHFLFEPGKVWTPVAIAGKGAFCIAAVRAPRSANDSPVMVFPMPALTKQSDFLTALATHPCTRPGPTMAARTRALTRLVVAACIVACFVTAARFNQRREFARAINQGYWGSTILDFDYQAQYAGVRKRLGKATWGEVLGLETFSDLSPADLAFLLEFYSAMGLHAHEGRVMNYLLEGGGNPHSVSLLAKHLEDSVYPGLFDALQHQQLEDARYLAQRYLNFTARLPYWVGFHHTNNEQLNSCRKVLDLVNGNFLFRDPTTVGALVDDVDWGGRDLLHSDVDPSLSDNIAYHNVHLNTSGGYERWLTFAFQYPDSEKADDAAFNAASVALYTDGKQASRLAEAFLTRFPKSYLADDALYYILRVACEDEAFNDAATAFERLATDYSESDSLKRVQYLMLRSLEMKRTNHSTADQLVIIATRLASGDRSDLALTGEQGRGEEGQAYVRAFLNLTATSGTGAHPDPRKLVARFIEITLGGLYGSDWVGR